MELIMELIISEGGAQEGGGLMELRWARGRVVDLVISAAVGMCRMALYVSSASSRDDW